ncbi:MacB-like periplasmic core domain protein [uncultured archaeon]|nr:MacB-like periplasmic core domain protein [uncultured archaeon]
MSSVFFYARKDAKKNWKMFIFVIIAIAISTANIIIINGFMDGLTNGFLEKTMDTSSGHINIYPNEQDKYIEGLGIKEKKIEGMDEVAAYSPRITAGGALHYKEKFKTVKILALDPLKENEVTILLSKIDSGETLAANDRDGTLISYRLANDLKVKVGDEVTIVFENGKTRLFKIRGILHTGLAMDANTVIINFEEAAEQLNLYNKASIILVKLHDEALSGEYKNKISRELGIQKIKEWKQEIESVLSSFKTFRDISNLIIGIGLFTGGVSVGIVLYINILHKRRQIGILKAIGMKDLQILFVYILQAVFLGTIGILIGDILGYAGTKYLEAHPFPDPTLGSLGPRFHLFLIYDTSLVTMLIVILAAAFPAIMAGRTNIIKAIWGE